MLTFYFLLGALTLTLIAWRLLRLGLLPGNGQAADRSVMSVA